MSTHTIGKTGVALAVGALLLAAAPPARAQQGVTVQLFQFKPGQIEVKAGTRLTWTNQDDITHTVTSGTPEQRDGRFEVPLDGRGAAGSSASRGPIPTSAAATSRCAARSTSRASAARRAIARVASHRGRPPGSAPTSRTWASITRRATCSSR